MKYVFIEKHQAEFSIKAMCRVLQVARSGWYAWRLRCQQITPRQQFRLACDTAVRKAFTEAKQLVRLVSLTNCLSTTSKRLQPVCDVRDFVQRLPGISARSATENMTFLCLKIC